MGLSSTISGVLKVEAILDRLIRCFTFRPASRVICFLKPSERKQSLGFLPKCLN